MSGPAGEAQASPAPGGRVTDAADLLPATEEQALEARLAALERRTRHQFVVVTVPSLDGRDVADYARDLGNRRGIGRKGVNDGVMLLVAPHERKLRIAVGDGLTGVLTDDEAKQIIETRILPDFRAGHVPEGIASGADAIIAQLSETKA